jgi:transcriptional regulator with GAF, ATPase, and Fis domain
MAYVVKLEGYDPDWQPAYTRQVEYRDLPLGEYTFQVKAVDRDLNYSEPASVRVVVEPDPHLDAFTRALSASGTSEEFVGASDALHRMQTQLREVAPTDLTVLILGETGTGKGLAARTLHALSPRRGGPFIQVNCGAIPEGLVESELFGHERGAFTGAAHRQMGRVELAEGGTLFLDEIGDMPLAAQTKLLHVLEEHTFQRVGGTEALKVEVRIIAATNRDLGGMVRSGAFREDLYFRLQGFVIALPPLRDRVEDIPLLAEYFAERFARHLDRAAPAFSEEAVARLQTHTWPGNVRELEHVVQRGVLMCTGDRIEGEDVVLPSEPEASLGGEVAILPLEEHEKRHIERALKATGGVIFGEHGAAKLLDINPHTLRARIKRYGLHSPE